MNLQLISELEYPNGNYKNCEDSQGRKKISKSTIHAQLHTVSQTEHIPGFHFHWRHSLENLGFAGTEKSKCKQKGM